MSRRIFLRDYEVVASIGIHEFERQNPQRIIIDVALEIAEGASPGNGQDRIETVLDYDFLRERIRSIVGDLSLIHISEPTRPY